MRTEVNLLVGGEAGQGLATIGQVLTRVLVRSGYRVVVTQDYMSRIRGGHNTFAIRAATEAIAAPRETYDCLVALDAETVALHAEELADGALVIRDETAASSGVEAPARGRVEEVTPPLGRLATGKYQNTAALGVAAAALGLSRQTAAELLESLFGKKKGDEVADANVQALGAAYDWYEAHAPGADVRLAPVEGAPFRICINGNEAIALGAMSAGARFCSFYPMTPSTSIPLTLAAHASKVGMVVEQAEDEIAAINMALGASYAGAPAIVATSGGGFALMVEGISLAGMIETPVVVVVSQRPGPATGLPTRTEQGDLELVLHAGHGEFPRAIFAPGSVEECFEQTRRAFEMAEKTQSPAFVLTDQFLADSYRAVDPFDVAGLPPVGAPAEVAAVEEPYLRFEITDSGVSPRLLPGRSEHLVVVDSDEHTEDGHITEDLGVRIEMVDKRLRKGAILRDEALAPTVVGDERPDVLLVSWGSTRGSVEQAAAQARADGRSVGTVHFGQVWPLVPEAFLRTFEAAGTVVAVEGNATGQFARLLRRETGFEIETMVLRYDGLPITPEYVARSLASAGIW